MKKLRKQLEQLAANQVRWMQEDKKAEWEQKKRRVRHVI